MTPEFALRLGRAFIKFNHGKRIIIGRDTRLSCRMLESALASGMSSEGAEVQLAGVIPTPGVSYAVREAHADGGAVISASHNPAEYNGIKFLGSDGCKLSDEAELAIEDIMDSCNEQSHCQCQSGRIVDIPEVVRNYALHTASLLESSAVVDNIAFDCANGASSVTVPVLVREAFSGLNAHVIARDFDGLNINKSCGVMHMQNLTGYVTSHELALGFAFDGDADRVLISDSHGRIIDGDII